MMNRSRIGIDASLLSVLRVFAVMLWRDGRIDEREAKWFRFLVSRFEVSSDQKQQLWQDLEKCPDLGTVFSQIDNEFDRGRLLDWLRIAINLDGKCSENESRMFHEIQKLKASDQSLANDIVNTQIAMEAASKHAKFWKTLGRFGKRLGKMTPYSMFINSL